MKLVDSNVWLALAISGHAFHTSADAWFGAETQPGEVLFCRATQQSFLRLLTTDAVFSRYGIPPLRNIDAWAIYEGFLADVRVAFSAETNGVDAIWKRLATRKSASPKIWMDAYLAAVAMAGDHQLVTTDADFKQFKGLNSVILTKS